MAAADVIANPPGRPLGYLHKRPGDDRVFAIDCTPLLRPHELMIGPAGVEAPDLVIGPSRTRVGTLFEVRLAGGTVPAGQTYVDHMLAALARTTQGVIDIRICVRVHR